MPGDAAPTGGIRHVAGQALPGTVTAGKAPPPGAESHPGRPEMPLGSRYRYLWLLPREGSSGIVGPGIEDRATAAG